MAVSEDEIRRFGGSPVARIDLDALVHNLGEVRRIVGAGVDVLAMVKANAYGHGAGGVAAALWRAGCKRFGVATVAEGQEVAAAVSAVSAEAAGAGPYSSGKPRVAVFGGLQPAEAEAAVAAGLEVVTQEREVVDALGAAALAAGCTVPVHTKVDTGMTRLGVDPADAVDFVRHAAGTAGVEPAGICSHFAQAESVVGTVTEGQLSLLNEAHRACADAGFPLTAHLANSAGILTRPEAHLDMVRPGLMLYGLYPDDALTDCADLRPVMSLTARVVRIREVPADTGVSYGHTVRTTGPTRVATVRVGYADGYPRSLSGRGWALADGVRLPVLGRVCMDQTMLDVTGAPRLGVGDSVPLWGPAPCTAEVASAAGTISYELVARVGPRVRREFTGG